MPTDPLLNREFGPYIILKRLGLGGMAETYLALKQGPFGVQSLVALKCILSQYNNIPDYVKMFYHEAGISLLMNHPNVIHTWDIMQIEHRHTMVMEFLNGVTLEDIIKTAKRHDQPIPLDVAVWIAVNALEGLEYIDHLCDTDGVPLHVIHRDVSPQNIFTCYDGHCVLFDFGVACSAKDVTGERGMIVGKYAYMSPEQCRGESIDSRSDTFALAVVLYEIVTGRVLFASDNDVKTIEAVNSKVIVAPNAVKPEVPPTLSKIIMHGLERDPARRYLSARAFADELRMFMKISGYAQTGVALCGYLQRLFDAEIETQKKFMERAMREAHAKFPPPSYEFSEKDSISAISEIVSISEGSLNISVSRLPMMMASQPPSTLAPDIPPVAVQTPPANYWKYATIICGVLLLAAVIAFIVK